MKKTLLSIIAILFISNLFAQVKLDSALVAYYPFNGNANDTTGHGYNGIPGGGQFSTLTPTKDRNNKANSAYSFGGGVFTCDDISVPYDSSFYTKDLSAVVWVYFTTLGKNISILRAGNTAQDLWKGYDLTISQGTLYWNDYNGTTYNGTASYPASNFKVNTWYNIIVTRSDSSLKLYINGSVVKQVNGLVPYTQPKFASFVIGSKESKSECFEGKMDDIRIYSRPINQAEISALAAYTPVGIADVTENKILNVYPNPSTDGIFNFNYNSPTFQVSVINTLGQEVFKKDFKRSEGPQSVNLSELPKGMFYFIIKNGGTVSMKRIVRN